MEYQPNTVSHGMNNSKYGIKNGNIYGEGYIHNRLLMNDTDWNKNRYMLREIIQNNIQKKKLFHKQGEIFSVLDNIVQNMKPQVHMFSNKTELNKAILNEVGLYITEIITNENVKNHTSSSTSYLREDIKHDNNQKFMDVFSSKKQEFESYHKPSPPKPIQFEDDTTLEDKNNNIEDMLKKEIAEREDFDNSIIDNPNTPSTISQQSLSRSLPQSLPQSNNINNIEYQIIETPVFSLTSNKEIDEIPKKIKSQNPKPLKSILKTRTTSESKFSDPDTVPIPSSSSLSLPYISRSTKWFIDVPFVYTPIKSNHNNGYEDENQHHDFLISTNDEPFLSFINSNKNEHHSLSIEQVCIFENQLTELQYHSLIYMYTFTDSEHMVPNTSSILFTENVPKSSSHLRSYHLYKGNSPVNNHDIRKKYNKNKEITNIIFTTVQIKDTEWNFYFSLFSTKSEIENREKKINRTSIQLSFYNFSIN